MKKNSAVNMIVSVLLVLTVLAGSWQTASAAFIDANHYAEGRSGIYLPAGLSAENIRVQKQGQGQMGWTPLQANRSVFIEANFEGNSDQTIPTSLTYVFFNLRRGELRAWQEGNLNIYYQDPNTGTWTSCNAFIVGPARGQGQDQQGQQDQDQADNDTEDNRLACVAPAWNTVYVLGTPRAGMENRISQQTVAQNTGEASP